MIRARAQLSGFYKEQQACKHCNTITNRAWRTNVYVQCTPARRGVADKTRFVDIQALVVMLWGALHCAGLDT
jgi:hypothetical protein